MRLFYTSCVERLYIYGELYTHHIIRIYAYISFKITDSWVRGQLGTAEGFVTFTLYYVVQKDSKRYADSLP